jgi:multiple sugar transport system ATP-binding protein
MLLNEIFCVIIQGGKINDNKLLEEMIMVQIQLKHIDKKYPNNPNYSVKDFNLDVKDKEFIVFVGPSGCGKSTTLRMIAGLEDITDGELYIGDELMNDVAPKDRNIAMVFQNYALYPHMTVFDNIAFGLKLRKYPKDEIKKRVEDAAEVLGLTELLDRKPADMSGGQRQRVAMGRAIVRDAKVLLMDEPLSNLDAKLRVQMRAEIAKIHQRMEATTIYVTHDQTEAMTLADRIVIMSVGEIQQVGTPQELYNEPVNKFVAGFIGSPAMNFFEVTYKDGTITNNAGLTLNVPEGMKKMLDDQGYDGKELTFGIRPEDINSEAIAIQTYPEAVVKSKVTVSELLGNESMLYSMVGDTEFVSKVPARDFHNPGEEVELAFNINKGHFFDKETEKRIVAQ